MSTQPKWRKPSSIIALLAILMLPACQRMVSTPAATRTPPPVTANRTRTPLPTEGDYFQELLQHTPVPWTTPLPPLEETVLDGIYVKHDPSEEQWWNCLRCADWLASGGIWRLILDRGQFWVYYTENGWRSLGSYTVDGDHVYFFNDPYCQWEVGEYTWRLVDGKLTLVEVDDPCSTSFRLRAGNLTKQPWLACPAGTSAGAPDGCTETIAAMSATLPATAQPTEQP